MNFLFNRIYVVQSLCDEDTQTGSQLFEDIIQRRSSQAGSVDSILVDILSKIEFYEFFESLFSHSVNGFSPYLHFEIHGSEKGLQLKNGDFVEWDELRPLLSRVNYQTKNNLFVSLATCYGAYIHRAIDILDRVPFCGYVGPATEITEKEVEADWEIYFDLLFTKKDFQAAIEGLNLSNPKMPYVILSSKQVFDLRRKVLLDELKTRKNRRERLKSMTKKAKNFPVVKEKYSRSQQKEIYKKYISKQPEIWDRIEDYFMLRTDRKPFEGLRL